MPPHRGRRLQAMAAAQSSASTARSARYHKRQQQQQQQQQHESERDAAEERPAKRRRTDDTAQKLSCFVDQVKQSMTCGICFAVVSLLCVSQVSQCPTHLICLSCLVQQMFVSPTVVKQVSYSANNVRLNYRYTYPRRACHQGCMSHVPEDDDDFVGLVRRENVHFDISRANTLRQLKELQPDDTELQELSHLISAQPCPFCNDVMDIDALCDHVHVCPELKGTCVWCGEQFDIAAHGMRHPDSALNILEDAWAEHVQRKCKRVPCYVDGCSFAPRGHDEMLKHFRMHDHMSRMAEAFTTAYTDMHNDVDLVTRRFFESMREPMQLIAINGRPAYHDDDGEDMFNFSHRLLSSVSIWMVHGVIDQCVYLASDSMILYCRRMFDALVELIVDVSVARIVPVLPVPCSALTQQRAEYYNEMCEAVQEIFESVYFRWPSEFNGQLMTARDFTRICDAARHTFRPPCDAKTEFYFWRAMHAQRLARLSQIRANWMINEAVDATQMLMRCFEDAHGRKTRWCQDVERAIAEFVPDFFDERAEDEATPEWFTRAADMVVTDVVERSSYSSSNTWSVEDQDRLNTTASQIYSMVPFGVHSEATMLFALYSNTYQGDIPFVAFQHACIHMASSIRGIHPVGI